MAIESTEKEPLDLRDIRSMAKHPHQSGFLCNWVKGDAYLAQPFQEMAGDISMWFKQIQGWKLVEVSSNVINDNYTGNKGLHLEPEPDRLTSTFYFQTENPPTKGLFFGFGREIDFENIFSPFYEYKIQMLPESKRQLYSEAKMSAKFIGSVYPLEQAIQDLSSPYFLETARVGLKLKPMASNKQTSTLRVNVVLVDLDDYLRLEVAKMRRIRAQLAKNFP